MAGFDIDRFLELSRAVDLSDIDWEELERCGLTSDELAIVRYMADTELHTAVYMRDLLAGHTAQERDVRAFLACWVYEETHHGLALERVLATVGQRREASQFQTLSREAALREWLEAALSTGAARATPHFAAVHMAWGALNEATAAATYGAVARTTANRPLARLLTKLARDERRHFAFYFWQAERRLHHPLARALCRIALSVLWGPVGVGVGGSREVIELVFAKYFATVAGRAELRAIEQKIGELPGQARFDSLTRAAEACIREFGQREPVRFAHLMAQARVREAAPPAGVAPSPPLYRSGRAAG